MLAISETVKPFFLEHLEALFRRFPSDCGIAGVWVIVVVDRRKKGVVRCLSDRMPVWR